jgi:hypothetical protein
MARLAMLTAMTILIAAILFAVPGALAGSASAAGWHVSGTELTGTQTAAVATTAVNDKPAALNVPALPLKITCDGSLTGVSPVIAAPNSTSTTSLTFHECSVVEPATCKLESPEIKTEAVTGTVRTATGTADHILFKPTTAKHFTEFELEGSSCSVSGKKAITGSVVLKMATAQTESSIQALEGLGTLEQGTDGISVANDPSYIEGGKLLLKLESGSKWSFH